MEISYAFFAEAAQNTSDGRLNILGADISALNMPCKGPWTTNIFFLASIHFEREECGRLYRLTVDLLAPNGSRIDPHIENNFVAAVPDEPDLLTKMTMVLHLGGISFPTAGLYYMSFRVEDPERNVARERQVRLRIVEGAPPAQPS
jgi:hypothetical protein